MEKHLSYAAILPTRDIMILFLKKSLMPRGRKTSLTIRLTPAQRQTLLAWQRATTIPAGQARRGRMLLLLADGMTITDIAAAVGISRRFVYKWVQRFLQEGLEGLQDKSRRNRRIEPRLPDRADQNDADIVF
jgi:DNA invertase Pin-like site-specific DNA recombinase